MTSKTAETEPQAELLTGPLASLATAGANGVEDITKLADKAGSALVTIRLPESVSGVPEEIPVFLNREAGNVSSVHELFERYRQHPVRKAGTAKVTTLESFIDLTERHKTEHSAIFANTDWQKPALTTVVDYHEAKSAGLADNGKHRVHYDFPLSEEWKAWMGINGKPLDQGDFAEFIEDHISELSAPDTTEEEDFRHKFGFRVAFPNELVELSRGLEINVGARMKNKVNLQSGASQIVFEEEHTNAVGGTVDVPGLFILSIAPFFLGDPCRIPVRLRYRPSGGKLVWICQLYRPDVYVTQQVMRDMERAASETDLPHFQGAPEMTAAGA